MGPSEYNSQPETGGGDAYGDAGDLSASGPIDPRDGAFLWNATHEIDIAYQGVVRALHVFATGHGNATVPGRQSDNAGFHRANRTTTARLTS